MSSDPDPDCERCEGSGEVKEWHGVADCICTERNKVTMDLKLDFDINAQAMAAIHDMINGPKGQAALKKMVQDTVKSEVRAEVLKLIKADTKLHTFIHDEAHKALDILLSNKNRDATLADDIASVVADRMSSRY